MIRAILIDNLAKKIEQSNGIKLQTIGLAEAYRDPGHKGSYMGTLPAGILATGLRVFKFSDDRAYVKLELSACDAKAYLDGVNNDKCWVRIVPEIFPLF